MPVWAVSDCTGSPCSKEKQRSTLKVRGAAVHQGIARQNFLCQDQNGPGELS